MDRDSLNSQMDGPVNHDVQLDPPIGTCYFKSYKYTVSHDDWPLHGSMDVTFYVYVTLAKPTDKNFTANGGKVYIVAVYNGSIGFSFSQEKTVGSTPVWFFGLYGVPSRTDQLPIPGSQVKEGDTRLYTIDFAHTMSMYKNNGNNEFSFPARYKRSYSMTGYIQSEYQQVGWSLDNQKGEATKIPIATNGLQIFELDRLGTATCKLFFGVSPKVHKKEFTLDFSAETMSKAVVGG